MAQNNEGPPDLDEILRKLQQKIAGALGFKPRTTPGGNGMGAAMGGGLAFVVLLAIAVWLASGFYIVEEGRKGVVLRLGKFTEITDAGPRWHIPYPFESVEIVNVSGVRTVEVGYRGNPKNKQPQESLMLTDDENIVDVQFAVQYTLKSPNGPNEFLFNNKDPEDNVRQAAETAIRETVGKSKMDFVLNQGRSQVAAQVKKLMQDILDRYKTGINITTVNLQNVQAPEQVQAAFDDAVRAGQDRERFKNEGQAYYNDVVPKAKGVAARLTEEANGYRQSVIANAQGDASRFMQVLAEYQKAPQVTRERMYLDTMQQVMQATSKILVDQKQGQSLLYLPLSQLMQMAQQNAPAASDSSVRTPPADSTTVTPPQDTSPPVSRREGLRSRDREAGR